MLNVKLPQPVRRKVLPQAYEPDENGVLDVGYALGVFRDGRPYRLEAWQLEDLEMLTVFFSATGLEAWTRADMPLLLEGEGLLAWAQEKQRNLQAAITTDDAGNSVWAVNLLLSDAHARYVKLLVTLRRYR